MITKNENGQTTVQSENGLITEISEFGLEIAKRVEERQQPLKDIASYYDEARKVEADALANAEAHALASLPAKPLTTDEQIQALTKMVTDLTKQISKGDER